MKGLRSISTVAFCLLMGINSCAVPTQKPDPSPTGNTSGAHSIIWIELLQKTPHPHTAPLPPQRPTVLDGFYTKFDPKETPPVPCRRCPDYVPAGGIWKLNFDKGIYRIFHEFTGWRSIGSFVVDGNRVQLFNDPTCMEAVGTYIWTVDAGALNLQVIEDECAIRMRAKNLTQLPWTICPLSSMEAGAGRKKASGCD